MHPGPNGNGEQIDDFACPASQNMGAQNPVRAFFHEHLVAGMAFRNAPGPRQVRRVLDLDPELEVLIMGCAFTETDSSQRWDGKHDRRKAEVICCLMVSFEEVCGREPSFV